MWIKKGNIYNVNGQFDWNKSHAQVPVVDVLEDRIRVYYSTRDESGRSNVSYIEVEKNKLELSPFLSFLNNDGLDIRIKYKLKKDNSFIDCPKVFLELDYYALINLLKN